MIIGDLIAGIKEPIRFTDRAVDDSTIRSILETARLAPSANNSQIWRFFIFGDERSREEAAALAGKPVFAGARTIIAACAEPWIVGRRGSEQPFFMIDVPIALSHVVLAAGELGVSVSLSFDFEEARLINLLGVPRKYRAVALVALGYAELDRSRTEEPPQDIVRIT